jgi:hypothetical protein
MAVIANAGRADATTLNLTDGTCPTSTSYCGSNSGISTVTSGGVQYYWFMGALWTTAAAQPSASTLDSFLKISSTGDVEEGMNTGGTVQENTVAGASTHAITTSDLTQVNINGMAYYEFLLDVSESGTSQWYDPLISLSDLKICTSNSGTKSSSDGCSSAGTQKYSLDGTTSTSDHAVLLDANENAGKPADLFVYIPVSTLGAPSNSTYVYLWSQFGLPEVHDVYKFGNDGGAEVWKIRDTTPPFVSAVPEPASVFLLGTGLLIGAAFLRKRQAGARA